MEKWMEEYEKELLKQGDSHEDIASRYRVSKLAIKDIESGRTWKHI